MRQAFPTHSRTSHRSDSASGLPGIRRQRRNLKQSLICLASLVLCACGGGGSNIGSDSGKSVVVNQEPPFSLASESSTLTPYFGPAPATEDVQQFKREFWDKLRANNRCGACHGDGDEARSNQSPTFAREDDVNQAYEDALTVIDTSTPADSVLVSKVAGGHNCWLSSASACEDILVNYIRNWTGDAGGASGSITLRAPDLREPGSSKNFPQSSASFGDLHTMLERYCAECHSDTSAIAIAPYFASADIDTAYAAAQSKIDLQTPANSRLVLRLGSEFHNCWSDCDNNAGDMRDVIARMADTIPATEVNTELVLSKAMRLTDGIVISGGGRVQNDLVALYQFKTGSGSTVFDTSGVDPALNLTLDGKEGADFEWVGGWGVRIDDSKAQGLTQDSRKLHERITASGEYSIEAWVAPANVTQEGPAIIVGYSGGNSARNFSLGQTLYNYDFLNRSSTTNANGDPAVSTPDDDEVLQATLQHVLATFDPVAGRRLYVNGSLIDTVQAEAMDSSESGGSLADWDDTFAFVLGNETSSDRLWKGTFRLVAIYDRALTPDQVSSNFEAGVGERFYLLFYIADVIGVSNSYIVFEVSQFDNYSYLFNQPFFIALDGGQQSALSNIPLQGMRIGLNGRELNIGQAYQNMNTTIDNAKLDDEGKQSLSALGTVIGLEKGSQNDEFFLTFEQLGSQRNVYIEAIPSATLPAQNDVPQPDIGLRTFAEINATMSRITGVNSAQSAVSNTFSRVKQQLPTVENIEGFLSAHQMAVTQLAIEYCNAMVDDSTLRRRLFDDSLFNRDANSISDDEWASAVIDPLMNAVMGANLTSQPDTADVRAVLQQLITSTQDLQPADAPDGVPDGLARCGGSCGSERSSIVVKASCAAMLGSAVTLLQ